jgi:hypothetical protein
MGDYSRVKHYQPVIIIGAGRSGTNMLRDILTQLPGFGTWSCDEINYIWRHGNIREPNDEFEPELATEQVKLFIRQKFERLARRQALDYVVEKTCANSLRVAFVHRIFPNAKFIHIIRDGRDVVASAQKRWTATLNIPYIMRKAHFVPITDLPYYASRYFFNHIYRLLSRERRLAFWGPRFRGMDQVLKEYSLAEVCAIQWRQCVEKAECDLNTIDPEQVYRLRYEDFVVEPKLELLNICKFLMVEISEKQNKSLIKDISIESVGKWKTDLNNRILVSIIPLIKNTLLSKKYEL